MARSRWLLALGLLAALQWMALWLAHGEAGSAWVPSPLPTRTATPSPTPTATRTPPPTPTATPIPSPTPTPPCMPGHWASGRIPVPDMGLEIPYRVYLPSCLQSGRRYPTLYLLHGHPYDESHWDTLGIDEALEAGIRAGRWPPVLIVLPGFPDDLFVYTSGGPGSVEAVLLEAVIPAVEAAYPAEGARWARAIGGISRGGVWALEIAFRHPEVFASVGGHSPALSVNKAPPDFDPFVLARQADLGGLRIYLSAGDSDWALEGIQRLAEALAARGIPVRLEVHPGAHEDALWAGALDAYLDFYTAPWRAGPP
ncbi:MAG: hypothetical protein C4313_09130 [Thermoflexus sp.]|uniref:alpha/beta hydrolase n=1 Tax=Thermoflexus sp. TaxID=1969742 RepID=UPI0033185E2A